jgi:hypothetical protein
VLCLGPYSIACWAHGRSNLLQGSSGKTHSRLKGIGKQGQGLIGDVSNAA